MVTTWWATGEPCLDTESDAPVVPPGGWWDLRWQIPDSDLVRIEVVQLVGDWL